MVMKTAQSASLKDLWDAVGTYRPGDWLLFGAETSGLPQEVRLGAFSLMALHHWEYKSALPEHHVEQYCTMEFGWSAFHLQFLTGWWESMKCNEGPHVFAQ